jgi:hypothetical protein
MTLPRIFPGLCAILYGGLALAACSSGPSPILQPLRPGADQQAVATKGLAPPPATGHYDAAVAPDNEERGLKVGELVKGKGGQQAQKDADQKAKLELEATLAREREELARQQDADQRSTAN